MNFIIPEILRRAGDGGLPFFNNTNTNSSQRDLTSVNNWYEGYKTNEIVRALVDRRANTLKRAPLVLKNMKKPDEVIPYNQNIPLYKLLYYPSQKKTIKNLISEIETYCILGGNCIVHVQRIKSVIVSMKAYSMDKWIVVPTDEGDIDHYIFSNGKDKIPVPIEDVIHFRWPSVDLQKPWQGMSPLMAGSKSIDASNEAGNLAISQLRKGVAPSYTVTVPSGEKLTQNQVDTIKESFSTRLQGKNSSNVAVVNEGTVVEKIDTNIADMLTSEFDNLPQCYLSELLKVPIQLTAFPAGANQRTYENYGEAIRAFLKEMQTSWEDYSETFTRFFENETFPGDKNKYIIAFDMSNIEELKIDLQQEMDKWTNNSITLDEFRERTGDSPYPYDDTTGKKFFAEISAGAKPTTSTPEMSE